MWTHWFWIRPLRPCSSLPLSPDGHQNMLLSPGIGVFFQLGIKSSFNKQLNLEPPMILDIFKRLLHNQLEA